MGERRTLACGLGLSDPSSQAAVDNHYQLNVLEKMTDYILHINNKEK